MMSDNKDHIEEAEEAKGAVKKSGLKGVSFQFPEDLLALLDEWAQEKRISRNGMMRLLVLDEQERRLDAKKKKMS